MLNISIPSYTFQLCDRQIIFACWDCQCLSRSLSDDSTIRITETPLKIDNGHDDADPLSLIDILWVILIRFQFHFLCRSGSKELYLVIDPSFREEWIVLRLQHWKKFFSVSVQNWLLRYETLVYRRQLSFLSLSTCALTTRSLCIFPGWTCTLCPGTTPQ